MTAAVERVRGASWTLWLVALYLVTLICLPPTFGPTVGGVVLSASRIVLVAAVVYELLRWRSSVETVRSVPALIWLGWAAFLGSALVTAFLYSSTELWARYGSLVLEGVVVFALVYSAALERGATRQLVLVMAIATTALAGVVLVLAFIGLKYDVILGGLVGSELVPPVLPRFGLERQVGSFRGALYFAVWMTICCALLLPWMLEGRGRARRLAVVAWVVLLVAVTLLTTSRLGVTGMFAVPGVYALLRGKRRIGAAFVIGAVVVAVAFTALSLDTGLAPAGTGEVLEGSNRLRLAALMAALDAISARPFFGWGLLSDMAVLGAFIGERNYVDNIYLSFLIDFGVIGTGAFLFLTVAIVAASRQSWRTPIGFALALALATELGMGILCSTLTSTQNYALFFGLAGLAVAAGRRSEISDAGDLQVLGPESPPPVSDSLAQVPGNGRDGQPEALT